MSCEMCGECCKYATMTVKDSGNSEWLKLHGMTIQATVGDSLLVMIPMKCSAFIDGKCTIYNTRPHICADFKCVKNVLNEVPTMSNITGMA